MLVGDLRDILKNIKDANYMYVENGTVKFSYQNRTVYGYIDNKFNLPDFMVVYLTGLYDILSNKKIENNEIVIEEEIITDSDRSFEFPLAALVASPFDRINIPTLMDDFTLSKIKADRIDFDSTGAYAVKEGINSRQRLNKNVHNVSAKVRIKDKLSQIPAKDYKYYLSMQTLMLVQDSSVGDIYYTVTLDSVADIKTTSEVDALLEGL